MASIMRIFTKAKIRTKILSIVIAICLFALLGMSIASFITVKKVSEYSARTNTALGYGAADSASSVLKEVIGKLIMLHSLFFEIYPACRASVAPCLVKYQKEKIISRQETMAIQEKYA